MAYWHKNLAAGGWKKLLLIEQLGNIGSEVFRASRWQNENEENFKIAVYKALELFDLTLDDSRWKGRLQEIIRIKDVFCDTALNEGKVYKTDWESLNQYFFQFAWAAREDC